MQYYLGAAMGIAKIMDHLVAIRPHGPGYNEKIWRICTMSARPKLCLLSLGIHTIRRQGERLGIRHNLVPSLGVFVNSPIYLTPPLLNSNLAAFSPS